MVSPCRVWYVCVCFEEDSLTKTVNLNPYFLLGEAEPIRCREKSRSTHRGILYECCVNCFHILSASSPCSNSQLKPPPLPTQIPLTARSPDVTPCDLLLWWHSNEYVYQRRRQAIKALKEVFTRKHHIDGNDTHIFRERLRQCVNNGGRHLPDIVCKTRLYKMAYYKIFININIVSVVLEVGLLKFCIRIRFFKVVVVRPKLAVSD